MRVFNTEGVREGVEKAPDAEATEEAVELDILELMLDSQSGFDEL